MTCNCLSCRLRGMYSCTNWQEGHSATADENQFWTRKAMASLKSPSPMLRLAFFHSSGHISLSSMAPRSTRIAAAGVRAGEVMTVAPWIISFSYFLCSSPMSLILLWFIWCSREWEC